MNCKLSKTEIESFQGDVLPLWLEGDSDLTDAEIQWTVEGDCVTARSFKGDVPYSFHYGVLLTLVSPGEATVTATYEGQVYSCAVSVRPMEKASSNEELQYFFGDLHAHTSKDHKAPSFAEAVSTIPDYVQHMKKEERLDVSVISDHADVTNPRDFFRGFTEAERRQPMHCILFPGSESEITFIEEDRLGLSHKNSGEIVCVNTDNFISAYSWAEFSKAMETSPYAVCVFAHPQIVGYDKNGVWNFCFHKNNTPQMKQLFRGVEMGDGSDRSSNCLHELAYSVALDCGFRVSATGASDCHGPNWGFDRMRAKTVLMAPKKSKEAFLDALLHNRFYATESGNVKLRYTVNGQTAPADLKEAEEYRFHIEWDLFNENPEDRPIRLQVISDYGETVYETKDFGNRLDFTVSSTTARYFYLRLTDQNGCKTRSCPVWTGRPFSDMTPPVLPPLNKAGFTATDLLTGKDASILLNNDPSAIWEGSQPTAELLIDLGKEQTVQALGHYPPRMTRSEMTLKELSDNVFVASFACRYRISTSADGKHFTPQAEGIIRVFGAEEILTFPAHSARYLKFEVLSTTGQESEYPKFRDLPVLIGELTIF